MSVYGYETIFFTARPLWFMLLTGVFERFPGLKMAVTEAGSFWAADLLWRVDMMATREHGMRKMVNTRGILTMLPSEYFDRNVKIGVVEHARRRELGRRYEIGVGNIMWGNDFPHPEGTWPYTREFLKDRFWDIPIDETEQILGLNQADFYGFDLDKLQPIADRIGPTPDDLGQTDESVFAKWEPYKKVGPPVAHGRGGRRAPHRQVIDRSPTTRSVMSAEPLDPGAPPGARLDRRAVSRPNLRLEVTYLTDPEIHAAVLPPPLTAPPEPRVRVHFTRIEVERQAARDRELVPARRDVRRHARPVLRGDADRPRDRGHAEPRDVRRAEEARADRSSSARATTSAPASPARASRSSRSSATSPSKLAGARRPTRSCSSGTSSCPRCRARASTPGRSSSRCTRR